MNAHASPRRTYCFLTTSMVVVTAALDGEDGPALERSIPFDFNVVDPPATTGSAVEMTIVFPITSEDAETKLRAAGFSQNDASATH